MGVTANPASVPGFQIGGRYLPIDIDAANVIILVGRCSGTGQKTTARNAKTGATSGYQVPVGKTLKLIGARIQGTTATLSKAIILYADADVGYDGTTAFTTPIYESCSASGYTWGQNLVNGLTIEVPLSFDVPAQKYVGIDGQIGDYTCHIFGILR